MKKPVKSFYDLEVCQRTYQAAIAIIKRILPKLPKEERFDLDNQIRRSVKAVPRLIAEADDKTSRQLQSLSLAWSGFKLRKTRNDNQNYN